MSHKPNSSRRSGVDVDQSFNSTTPQPVSIMTRSRSGTFDPYGKGKNDSNPSKISETIDNAGNKVLELPSYTSEKFSTLGSSQEKKNSYGQVERSCITIHTLQNKKKIKVKKWVLLVPIIIMVIGLAFYAGVYSATEINDERLKDNNESTPSIGNSTSGD
eukprot:snap_masked-scaffold_2-processed-gene-8.21-mRNA-1 protein AED:1.00 eAED:1.00 QI:0/-1/0/0/-1/1/1/0/159